VGFVLTDSSEPDPIFAAIERHRKAYAAMRALDAELLNEHCAGTLSPMKEAQKAVLETAGAELYGAAAYPSGADYPAGPSGNYGLYRRLRGNQFERFPGLWF
jgi:hypothetical protein